MKLGENWDEGGLSFFLLLAKRGTRPPRGEWHGGGALWPLRAALAEMATARSATPPRFKRRGAPRKAASGRITPARRGKRTAEEEEVVSAAVVVHRPLSEPGILPPSFFHVDSLDLAPRLLGKLLRRDDVVLRITEVADGTQAPFFPVLWTEERCFFRQCLMDRICFSLDIAGGGVQGKRHCLPWSFWCHV